MRSGFERVSVTRHGDVAVLALNHPEVMNALSARMLSGLSAALDFVTAPESGFRALVLTGEGRGFCSGANLAEGPVEGADIPTSIAIRLDTLYHPLLRRLRDLSMPVVTAVNGAAAGMGMSLALMGDLICAARSAYFLQAFARIGLVPDGGSTWILPRLIGFARARELSLLGEKLTAEKALEWGLVNRVFDDTALMEGALALADKLAEGPTAALAITRRLYWDSAHNGYDMQLERECTAQQQAGRTGDFAEGVAAFLQKRPPAFKGK